MLGGGCGVRIALGYGEGEGLSGGGSGGWSLPLPLQYDDLGRIETERLLDKIMEKSVCAKSECGMRPARISKWIGRPALFPCCNFCKFNLKAIYEERSQKYIDM